MPATKAERLRAYRSKRSADRTPEPFGGVAAKGGRLFVVQHHAARRLHYDLRLEIDGALHSWAVPKGPSPNPADKRLAVEVEDHPLEYGDFEGRIPEGNYGAGASIVWDRGVWIPAGDPQAGLVKGKLLFDLKGYKLRGRWTLVRTRRNQKDWLLIKERDAWASSAGTEDYPADSILSGRTVAALRAGLDPAKRIRARLKRLRAPRGHLRARTLEPMLAQSGAAFSRSGWLFEIKYDGYRLIAARDGGETALYSRAGNELTATFPEIASAVHALPFERLIIDGEAVVHDERGMPSFSLLQKRGRLARRADIKRAALELPATFYVFDLLAFDDYDLRPLPLKTRKTLLHELLPTVGPLRYSEHIETDGEALYEQARALGLEGIIAKKADAPYRIGRAGDWIKIRLERSDDFVVIGYTDPKGSQPGFGALLLAQYEDGELVYAGRAGTGFRALVLREIADALKHARSARPPRGAPAERGLHWVDTELVCEVKFSELTPDGVLRQPVFVRLRDDKPARACVRRPRAAALPEPPAVESAAPAPRRVRFTNLDKVLWPEQRYTKSDLIAYYRGVARWILPYLKDRPVVLTRYPDGIEGKSFFQKDAPDFVPEWIRIERLWSEGTQREISYFVVEDVESLLYIANMATIPLHIWSSRMAHLDRPDWCILDLDPKEAPFKHVVQIAKRIRGLCRELGLPAFPKTSGSTGLHVLIPLGHRYSYEQARTLGELLARVVVRELPDIATVTRSPARREQRVYIDYLQNGHGRLLVAPFSVRPLPGAPVSMPLQWSELNARLSNQRFTIANAQRRMRGLRQDPLRAVLKLKPDLNAALQRLAKRLS